MKTRLPLWSIPVLSLIVVLGCTPKQSEPPTDTKPEEAFTDPEPDLQGKPFSNEVFVVVSTVGNNFSVLPDPVVVRNARQKVIWISEDPDVAVEITFRPDKEKDTPPGARPPGKPCPAPARKCGENQPIGGDVGRFYYQVSGTKAGVLMEPLDPVLEILY